MTAVVYSELLARVHGKTPTFQWRIQGGCFGCLSTPLNDRIHSFVSAMAQDFIYAKVAPPTTLERKRFGYKQHANRSTAGGRAKMLRPSVRYAMPFFRAATPLARLRPLQSTRGRGNYAI